jgi:hypothetical protein
MRTGGKNLDLVNGGVNQGSKEIPIFPIKVQEGISKLPL